MISAEKDNPWVNRFLPLLDRDEIRRRARVAAQPVTSLQNLPIEVACQHVNEALERIFVPTQRCCEILQLFVEIAVSHCLSCYPSRKAFLARCYERQLPACSMSPICLTGPAGSGKSKLIHALRRILPPDSSIRLNPGDHEFRLIASWNVSIRARSGIPELLEPLLPDARHGYYSYEMTQRNAFQSGVALLTADEFQFLTQSANANALVTQRLLELCGLQLPFIYIANYSLCHRLMRRPQEDVQRLLANPIVLEPEAPDSVDWHDLVREYKAACHEYLDIDPETDGDILHRYSAGLKRLSAHLLVIAYQLVRKDGRHTITLRDIERAYQSSQYTVNRRDVELMTTQWITGRMERPDLWCPFDLPASSTQKLADHAKAMRDRATAEKILKSSMTAEERKAYRFLKASKSNISLKAQRAEVIELAGRKAVTASELLKNAMAFQDQLKDKA